MAVSNRESTARRYREKLGRALLAVGVVAALVFLATANAVVVSNWSEFEDGVLWGEGADGVLAEDIEIGSPGHSAAVSYTHLTLPTKA